jgi:hypothetical protein
MARGKHTSGKNKKAILTKYRQIIIARRVIFEIKNPRGRTLNLTHKTAYSSRGRENPGGKLPKKRL